MASLLRKLFRRKKKPPLVCAVALGPDGNPIGDDPHHQHTSACFIDFEPLALVEFFQSQGCQACPPALPEIQETTNNPNLLLLTYNVTLFNHLGWEDTFATSAWDQRQRAYLRKWGRTSIFTPQLIVNGISDGSGSKGKTEIQDIIGQARSMHRSMDWHMYVDANDTDVRIDSDKLEAEPHDITLIVYRSGDQVVKVGKGPNKGKKMNHRNIVADVVKIGQWTGGDVTVPLPAPRSSMAPGMEAVVFVQQGPGGPIIASTKV